MLTSSSSSHTLFTPSGVRLRLRASRVGTLNWLFLPGGPGLGSESLEALVDTLALPGCAWLVDLPGDGSNIVSAALSDNAYAHWPQVLLEAARVLPNCVFVGHSTGGMYLLSVPELETHLCGLVLISAAPDASWRRHFTEMAQRNPLPEVEVTAQAFERQRTAENLRALTVAAAPWNFTPEALDAGRSLLAGLPYNVAAFDWSEQCFDTQYAAQWWPGNLPVLILSGAEDRIIAPSVWDAPAFSGTNVLHKSVQGAAHFPWIDRPAETRAAFMDFLRMLPM